MAYSSRVYATDATPETRELFAQVCTELDFEPVRAGAVKDMVPLSTRGCASDRRAIKKLSLDLGVSKNAVQLAALRMGLAAMGEVVRERSDG